MSINDDGGKTGTAKHTKGPWHWRGFGENMALTTTHSGSLIVLDAITSHRGMNPKVLLRLRDQERCLMVPFEASHPDARLIAAAPDMYAALVHVIGCIENEDGDMETIVRAALSKATGDTKEG